MTYEILQKVFTQKKYKRANKFITTHSLHKIGVSVFRDGNIMVWPYTDNGVIIPLVIKKNTLILSGIQTKLPQACVDTINRGGNALFKHPDIKPSYHFTVDITNSTYSNTLFRIERLKTLLN